MIKTNNKEKVIEEINANSIVDIFNIIPNLSDKVLDYNEKEFNIIDIIDTTFDIKRKHTSQISSSLFLISGIQARMKQQFSISELSLALTSKNVIEKLNINMHYDKTESLLKEANRHAWLSKYEQ